MSTPTPADDSISPDEAWLERNWSWALPSGCLTVLLFVGGCLSAMYYGGIQAVKNSSPYKEAVEMARKHPAVIEALGEPIESGMLGDDAQIKPNEDRSGTAKFNIPLTGPKAGGTLYVDAEVTKEQVWTFMELTFRLANSPMVVDVLEIE